MQKCFKFIVVIAVVLICAPLLSACGNKNNTPPATAPKLSFTQFTSDIGLTSSNGDYAFSTMAGVPTNRIKAVVQQESNFYVLLKDNSTNVDSFQGDFTKKANYYFYYQSYDVMDVLSAFNNWAYNINDAYAIQVHAVATSEIELRGGVVAVLNINSKNGGVATDGEVNATIQRLKTMLAVRGYIESTITKAVTGDGQKQLIIMVVGVDDISELFELIGEPISIDFRTSESASDIFLNSTDIISAVVFQNPIGGEWGVKVTFTSAGGQKFNNAIVAQGLYGHIYIFANGTLISQPVIADLDAGLDNTAIIYFGDGTTRQQAEQFKLQLESGLFETQLSFYESQTFIDEYALNQLGYGKNGDKFIK